MSTISACPDCNADVALVEASPSVYVLEIRHDDTCPTLAVIEGKR